MSSQFEVQSEVFFFSPLGFGSVIELNFTLLRDVELICVFGSDGLQIVPKRFHFCLHVTAIYSHHLVSCPL